MVVCKVVFVGFALVALLLWAMPSPPRSAPRTSLTASRARQLAVAGTQRWQRGGAASIASAGEGVRVHDSTLMPAASTTTRSKSPLYAREAAEWAAFEREQPADSVLIQALRPVLERVANNRSEVMLGIANDVMMCTNPRTCWWNGGNILASFIDVNRRVGISNYVIIALDDAVATYCREHGAPHVRVELEVPGAQKGSRGANMISTLKYEMLGDVLLLGYSVLVVDLDVAFLRDPFAHLHRDAELEGSSDGFTRDWTGGKLGSISDKSMGWGGGGLYVQVFTLNVGCVFVQPSPRTVALMRGVGARLKRAAAWDQQVFNEELWFPAYSERASYRVTIRVMDHLMWCNSKTFFKSERRRFLPGSTATAPMPVMVHTNYHPDKHKRMLCVIARYLDGQVDACDGFPGGSAPGT